MWLLDGGGHLAGSLGILSGQAQVLETLGCTVEDILPNAMVLCYPVVSSGTYAHRNSFTQLTGSGVDDELNRAYSLDLHVTEQTPPTFIWHTFEDISVPVENSLLLAAALRRKGVPFELHIFEKGEHGSSTCTNEVGSYNPHCAHWIMLCLEWLQEKLVLGELL